MAKPFKPAAKVAPKPAVAAKKPAVKPVAKTDVRNSAIPKIAKAAAPKVVTYDQIAKRAYEIYRSGAGGSETDNWHRAERELRGL